MTALKIDQARKIAIVGPGIRLSSLVGEAQKIGMMPDIESAACIDFTFSDWADETLRMISTVSSGIDGILRNVKVVSPTKTFQTGYDSFPANGGGYDLTKMYMSSGMSLGVPYEFTVPLRPISEIMVKRIYAFGKPADAVVAGMKVHRSGFPRVVKMRSAGCEQMLTSGKISPSTSETHLIVKLEGNQTIIDAAEKALDEIVSKDGGKLSEAQPDTPRFITPASIAPSVWVLGFFICDTKGLPAVISDITTKAANEKRELQYCVADLTPNSSVMIPIMQGPPSVSLLESIGSYLVSNRIPLRGSPSWNPLLGDSRAVPRVEFLRQIKKILDPKMILNSHAMEVF
jgi:FAD/FMN-containing dehydrogenase